VTSRRLSRVSKKGVPLLACPAVPAASLGNNTAGQAGSGTRAVPVGCHAHACRGHVLPLAVLLAGLVLAGCATYQVGNRSLYPAHIRTVYVPMFESNSYRRNLGERLTEAVMKEIEAKSPYKVVGTPAADSVLSGRITSETKRMLVEDHFDNPRESEVRLQVTVHWVDRRGGEVHAMQAVPLPPELSLVSASSAFIPEIGQSGAVSQQQAIQRLAEQIVAMMESPW